MSKDEFRKFEFGVNGASPGIGGVIVVLAHERNAARKLAEAEIARINIGREPYRPVTLGEQLYRSTVIELPAVVFSYDGEA